MVDCLTPHYARIGMEWSTSTRFHGCLCHIIALVAKDFLEWTGELTEEEMLAFETAGRASAEARFDIDPVLTSSSIQETENFPPANSGELLEQPEDSPRGLDVPTLETQDQFFDPNLLNKTGLDDEDPDLLQDHIPAPLIDLDPPQRPRNAPRPQKPPKSLVSSF